MSGEQRGIDPRLRVLYLAGVAIGAFALRDLRLLGTLVGVHIAGWIVLRQPMRLLARRLLKLSGFAAFILLSYALVSEDHVARDLRIGAGAVGRERLARRVDHRRERRRPAAQRVHDRAQGGEGRADRLGAVGADDAAHRPA